MAVLRRGLPRRGLRAGHRLARAGRLPASRGAQVHPARRGTPARRHRDRRVLSPVRQRRYHLTHRHPRHLRHPWLPGTSRSPAGPKACSLGGADRRHSVGRSVMNIRRELAIAGVVTLMATGAACSTKDNTGTGGTSGTKITLAFSAWPGWFPWQVAEEKGLFKANNVNVELKYFDDYLGSLTALATGNVTANSQTLNDTLISISAPGASKQTIVLV